MALLRQCSISHGAMALGSTRSASLRTRMMPTSCGFAIACEVASMVDEHKPKKKAYTRTKKPFTPKQPAIAVPKLDNHGRLRTPRAARELALSILYAAFVSGVHPLKVFDERTKQRASFDKSLLENYSHLPDDGENLVVDDEATASAMESALEAEASLEAHVLTAPPPLVYNRFVLSMARSLVKESAARWLQQEAILMEIIPYKWKMQPKEALLQICILQMALAEVETSETPPGVVVNETVELAKRFCDLAAPRIINGCLGSYIRRRKLQSKNNNAIATVGSKLDRALVNQPLQPEDLGFADDYTD